MSIHVTIGELFADMFDAEPELRPTCVADRRGVRADGELVGQLRLPAELLPIPAEEMFA